MSLPSVGDVHQFYIVDIDVFGTINTVQMLAENLRPMPMLVAKQFRKKG